MFKLLYLALTNISKKWTLSVKDWKSALNQLSCSSNIVELLNLRSGGI